MPLKAIITGLSAQAPDYLRSNPPAFPIQVDVECSKKHPGTVYIPGNVPSGWFLAEYFTFYKARPFNVGLLFKHNNARL